MPTNPSPSQAAASRANGAASRGPVTDAGKARAARNGTSHGLRGGDFCLLPGENGEELALLERAVAADWHPRDAFERHWAAELVAAMWRQQRLRRLELKALATADAEEEISEASLKRLQTLGRYGARIDADIGRALRALRVLKDRATADLAEAPPRTPEPDAATPRPVMPSPVRTLEPETAEHACPAPPLNRHERRRRAALERRARLAA
jgi:hypothetical protein